MPAVHTFIQTGECEKCGKTFERTRADAKYCSSTCRSRAKRDTAKATRQRQDLLWSCYDLATRYERYQDPNDLVTLQRLRSYINQVI